MKQLLLATTIIVLSTLNLLSQKGLRADYYNGTQFNQYVATNYVDNIDFYWDSSPPMSGLNPQVCSIRYTGRLKTPKTGVYTFSARVDDGIRVWVDSVQVISNWQLNDVGISVGKVELQANQFYTIKIEYFNALREAELRLLWKLPLDEERSWLSSWWYGTAFETIPSHYFAPPIEEEVEMALNSEFLPIEKVNNKPNPKKKVTPSSPPIQRKRDRAVPKEKTIDTIQQYLPNNIAFNRAEAEILPVSFPELDKLANFLVENPTRKVQIEGHTDNIGHEDKNLQLSKRRAYAVAAYLVKKGVKSNQLSAKGYGGTRPLIESKDKKYHPENRRVAFVIE